MINLYASLLNPISLGPALYFEVVCKCTRDTCTKITYVTDDPKVRVQCEISPRDEYYGGDLRNAVED